MPRARAGCVGVRERLPLSTFLCTAGETRTLNHWFWRPGLCQLSYRRIRRHQLSSLTVRRVLPAARAELRHLESIGIVLAILRRRIGARPAGRARKRDDRSIVLRHRALLLVLLRHVVCPLIESPPRGSNPRPRPYQGRALPTELGGQRHFSGHEKRVALRNSLEPLGQEDYPPTRRKRQGMPRKASLSGALQPDDGDLSGRLLQVIAEARVLRSMLLVEPHALGFGRDDGLRLPALLAGLDGDVGIRLQVVEPRGVLRSAAHRRDDDEVIALVRVDDGDSVLLAALRSLGRQHEHVAAD